MYRHQRFRQVPLEIRRTAVEQILSGQRRQIDVANELGLRRQTVHAWVAQARRGQSPGSRGRPSTAPLSDDVVQEITTDLTERTPADFGYRSSRCWNWQTVMLHAQVEYGLRIYRSYAIRLLQRAMPGAPARKEALTQTRRATGPLKPSELEQMRRSITATQSRLRSQGVRIGDDGLPRRSR